MKYLSIVVTVLYLIVLIACQNNPVNHDNDQNGPVYVDGIESFVNGILTDGEGHKYSTVRIGNQIWIAENWQCTHTTNGASISGVFIYDEDDAYLEEYGRLYSWEAAKDAHPSGWRLPNDADWEILIYSVGSNAANKLINEGSSGFNAQLGGRRTEDGDFGYLSAIGIYWTATQSDASHAKVRIFVDGESNVITDNTPKGGAKSVRYIKDL